MLNPAYGAWLASALMMYGAPAYAYIDPGAGSLALQLLLAGLFAAMMFAKQMWWRVKAFFNSLGRKAQKPND